MHGLETIIAMNAKAGTEAEREQWKAAKQRSRDRHFAEKQAQLAFEAGDATLHGEALEVVRLYQDAPRLTAVEQIALRFAKELLAAGIDGPAEFPAKR